MSELLLLMWEACVVYLWVFLWTHGKLNSLVIIIALAFGSLAFLGIPIFNIWACYAITKDVLHNGNKSTN